MRRISLSPHSIRLALLGFLLCVCIGVWSLALSATASSELTLAVLDVGQGDAIYVESPSGVQVLIDGGPDSAILRELATVMPQFDRSLDAVIATHPDQDHIGGLVDVLRRYGVGAFIEPGVEKNTAAYEAMMGEVYGGNIEHFIAQRGLTLDLGGGAQLLILYPDQRAAGMREANANDASIVAQLVYGSSTALLMGDAPKFVEYRVAVQNGAMLNSDVLKVGHHGSRTSTSDILLAAAQPALALMSAGKDNRYGHPHAEVTEALGRFGVETLLTAQEGTIVLRSDGETFYQAE